MEQIKMEGKRFNRLFVLSRNAVKRGNEIVYDCLCDCGKIKMIIGKSLRNGDTKSCGCFRQEVMKNKMMGPKNPMWMGGEAGYKAIHMWVRNHKKEVKYCERCKKAPPYDLANISGRYYRNVNDFQWLCRRCHMESDGRLEDFLVWSHLWGKMTSDGEVEREPTGELKKLTGNRTTEG